MWWSCRSVYLEGCIEEQIRNSHLLGSTKWPLKLPGSSFRIAKGNFCRQNYTPHTWWFYKSETWISSEPFSCKKLTEYPCRGCICPVLVQSLSLFQVRYQRILHSGLSCLVLHLHVMVVWKHLLTHSSCHAKQAKSAFFFLTFSCVQEALFSRVAHVGQHWLSLCQFNLWLKMLFEVKNVIWRF